MVRILQVGLLLWTWSRKRSSQGNLLNWSPQQNPQGKYWIYTNTVHEKYVANPPKDHEDDWRTEVSFRWGGTKKAGDVKPEEKAQGDLIYVYIYLMGGNEEDGARHFSVVPNDRTRGSRNKLKIIKFYLNTLFFFFLLWGWWNPVADCPEKLWSFNQRPYLKLEWTQSQATCFGWLLEEGVGLDYLKSSLFFRNWIGNYRPKWEV